MRIVACVGDFGYPALGTLMRSAHCPAYVLLASPIATAPPVRPGEELRALLRPLLWPGMPGRAPRDFRSHAVPLRLERAGIPYNRGPLADIRTLSGVLTEHRADLLLSVGWPRIVPPEILSRLPLGGVNVHPSLLPRYRGPSPVFWQVASGELRSGVTVHRMTSGIDEGPILTRVETAIRPGETAGSLFVRLARLGAQVLLGFLDRLAQGPVPEHPQDPTASSRQPRFRERHAALDWSRGAEELARLVRACNPYPGATSWLAGRECVRFWQASAAPGTPHAPCGTIVAMRRLSFDVATGSGVLRVRTARTEGGHRFPLWGRRWPTLATGEAFAPALTAAGSDASR